MGRIPEHLRVEVVVDATVVSAGAAFSATLLVANDGMQAIDATRPSARCGDVAIWQGDECYGGHEPFLFAQMVVPDTLTPGDRREVMFDLVADVPPGDYEVRGWYDAMSGPWHAAPVPLQVV